MKKPSNLFLILLKAQGANIESINQAGIPTLPLILWILRLGTVVSQGPELPKQTARDGSRSSEVGHRNFPVTVKGAWLPAKLPPLPIRPKALL